MAISSPSAGLSARLIQPQPKPVVTATNYLSAYDFTNQYDPAKHQQLLKTKARNKMTGFLDLMGMKESFSADQYYWAEEGEKHNLFTGVARTGTTFTITGHTFSKNDKVFVEDSTNDISEQAIVSVVTDANTVTLLPYGGAAFDGSLGTTGLAVYKSGSEYGKGTSGATAFVGENLTISSNKPIIEKAAYSTSGSDYSNIAWLQTEEGYFWTDYELERTKSRFEDELEVSSMTAVPSDAASPVSTTLNLNGAEGVFTAVKNRGNVFAGVVATEADWEGIIDRYDVVHAENDNYLFCNRDQTRAIDKWLGTINAHDTAKANYGVFENGEAMALDLGFAGFKKDGYTFYKQEWSLLINPLKLGAAENAESSKVNFLMIPHGMRKVRTSEYPSVDDSQGSKGVPYVTLMYKSRPGHDRFYREWVTGSVLGTPTNDEDVLRVDMLTERSCRVAGPENFTIGIGA